MTVVKGLATAILSFLLFLSLTVFGIAFLLQSTLLNPDFVSAQVNKLDISDITRDIAEDQLADELPEEVEFFEEAIYDIIDEQEPWLEEQITAAIYAAYDFFLGETDIFEIAIPTDELKVTLKDSLWQAFKDNLDIWFPDLVAFELDAYLDEHFDELVDRIPSEYLPPEIVGLPEAQIRLYVDQYLKDIAGDIAKQAVAKEITGLLEILVKPYFDDYYDDIAEQVPSVITLTENDVPADVWDTFLTARKYIGYFQTAYYPLIAFMILLVAGIILINRNIKDSTRTLGISLFIYGVLEFAGVLVAKRYIPTTFTWFDMPASVQAWLPGLYNDILAPVQWFSLGVSLLGAALIATSFFFKSRFVED